MGRCDKHRRFAVVSELSWLREQVPEAVREFFVSGYPDMHSIQQNLAVAENAGYRVLTTYTLPKEAWVEGYYDLLEPRATALIDHPDSSVRDFAVETIKEIEIFKRFRRELRLCLLCTPTRLTLGCS